MENELILVRPAEEFFEELSAYRCEFLENGDSMDGCGPLIRYDDMKDYLAKLIVYFSIMAFSLL